ncbi:MAG: S41 family peptidase [Bacteroidia bacterium]|nr:S41 family peptidase [Bacteroidia bacterium]
MILSQSTTLFAQSYWRVENDRGDEILLSLELNKSKNTFEVHTRKDALKDLAGTLMFSLAKAAGKLKYPEIVFIEGRTQQKKDTLLLNGNFNYFDKQFVFNAAVSENTFQGRFLDARGNWQLLEGIRVADAKPLRDYNAIITTAFSLTEKSVVNKQWLKNDEWLDFKSKVNSLKSKISDDYELAATFFWLGKKLPFTPYEISKVRPQNKGKKQRKIGGRKNIPSIRELKNSTVFFDANSFPSNKKEMDSISTAIHKKNYNNLVIDLRGNNKLKLNTAIQMLNYVAHQPFDAGAYLTRKWSDSNNFIPSASDYSKLLKSFADPGYSAGKLIYEQGRSIKVVPVVESFKGKVFLLVDGKTSHTAEMVASVLNNKKLATLVGQKTAGSTFLTENVEINEEFDLVLADAEFYTSDGKNLADIGVDPDVLKSNEDVMNYVLH